jgi:predicted site-specific integrase-resolvase
MKAVIYVRVSDARQADNTSLDAQEQYCRQWCARNGVQVVKMFIEAGASAKSANRPEFQRMFAWLEINHPGISHLVCDKWDRFSRSMDDAVSYRMKLKVMRIELVAATQAVTDDPAGRLMQNILQSFGQFDNEQRAERSLRGMKRQAEVSIHRQSRISANLFERISVHAICACEVPRLTLWRSGPNLPTCRPEQRPVGLLRRFGEMQRKTHAIGWEVAWRAKGYPQGERARACWMSFSVSKVTNSFPYSQALALS